MHTFIYYILSSLVSIFLYVVYIRSVGLFFFVSLNTLSLCFDGELWDILLVFLYTDRLQLGVIVSQRVKVDADPSKGTFSDLSHGLLARPSADSPELG